MRLFLFDFNVDRLLFTDPLDQLIQIWNKIVGTTLSLCLEFIRKNDVRNLNRGYSFDFWIFYTSLELWVQMQCINRIFLRNCRCNCTHCTHANTNPAFMKMHLKLQHEADELTWKYEKYWVWYLAFLHAIFKKSL